MSVYKNSLARFTAMFLIRNELCFLIGPLNTDDNLNSDSNQRPLVSEPTAQSTEPRPWYKCRCHNTHFSIPYLLCWNRALQFNNLSYVTSINQSGCFVKEHCSYSMLKCVYYIASRNELCYYIKVGRLSTDTLGNAF